MARAYAGEAEKIRPGSHQEAYGCMAQSYADDPQFQAELDAAIIGVMKLVGQHKASQMLKESLDRRDVPADSERRDGLVLPPED